MFFKITNMELIKNRIIGRFLDGISINLFIFNIIVVMLLSISIKFGLIQRL